MFAPDRRGQHLDNNFPERVVLRTADLVQQCRYTETTRIRAYLRNPRFGATVRIMQFKNELAGSGHVRCKKAVATLDPCEMHVGVHTFAQRRWCGRVLQKKRRTEVFRSLPAGTKTPRKNGPTLGKKPKKFAGRNRGHKKEMRRKEREIKT